MMLVIGQTFRVAAMSLVCLGMTGLVGCREEATSTPAPPVPVVQVVTVDLQTGPDEPEFIVQSEPSRDVQSRAQVT